MRNARRASIELLTYGEIERRRFDRWPMGFAAMVATNKAMLLRHRVSSRFEPLTLSGPGAIALLGELAACDVTA